MLYLFSGTDTFRMLERIKALEQEFMHAEPGGQKLLVDVEEQWDEPTRSLLVSTLSPGLFATPYIVVIRGAEVLEDKEGKWLVEALKQKDELMTVIVSFELGTKKKLPKWWGVIAEEKGVKEEVFKEISVRECEQYIERTLKNFDPTFSIEPKAKAFLSLNFVQDIGRLTQELHRLILSAADNKITTLQVEGSIVPTREAVTFQALDALIQGNRARAISLFRREETEADAPFALLGLCSWQVRRLIAIKELSEEGRPAADIARELKTSPYPIQKTLPLVSRFSMERLKHALTLLADFDQALKTGRLQPGVALDLFIWKF